MLFDSLFDGITCGIDAMKMDPRGYYNLTRGH